ncbi:MAG: sarcosine oxidase, alpha subunit [Betaproteobacteria bacterium]|nr:sarcosine oxidase, alpha subunit [Betaproteobacteria bacterium]
MSQPFRLASGGLIDRNRPLQFTFNGRRLAGYAGDTLASALLANGVRLIGRSFKYHRPRGIVCAGSDEPNALVQLETGAITEPNLRATQIELYDGLVAASQNCWPSVAFDVSSINNLLSRLLPAGFYYKTFMWPPSRWMTYEKWIRRVAGMGRAPVEPDPADYAHRHAHCDVLIAGGGPAGLAAAVAAARTGARVILADEGSQFGGSLLADRADIDGEPALNWVRRTVAELRAMPDVTLLTRGTVFGYFDHNAVAICERPAQSPEYAPAQRLWKVRARQVVLATGALERPLVFPNNDVPGVMLASAARHYANRYAVRPGSRAVIFTNNDSAYATALDLEAGGISTLVVDARRGTLGRAPVQAQKAAIECRFSSAIVHVHGGRRVTAVDIAAIDPDGKINGRTTTIDCDLVCMSGGWSPTVHLHSQAKGQLRYDKALSAFVPAATLPALRSAGSANGAMSLSACLSEGFAAGAVAALYAGHGNGEPPAAPAAAPDNQAPLQPLWQVRTNNRAKCFVDFQNDVTTADIALAAREGYTSVEHLKRYTTLGMGTDQGKLSNINGLAIQAQLLNASIPDVGTTTFRPPYTPVTLGAIAGQERGPHVAPLRLSPLDAWHIEAHATFINAGLWRRPQFYKHAGETDIDAVNREVRAVRNAVGLVDVSTLGKIDIKGRDAAELLERVYINNWKNLAIGKVRYGVMLREDGMVFDDGTTARLGEQHYVMTTTTANAVKVMSTLEYLLQVEWRDLNVYLTSVTEQWAAMALAGPQARRVLEAIAPGRDWSNAALPYMGYCAASIAGIPARVFRISFSGELSYEINVPADHARAMWEKLMAAGAPLSITPYGTEAMGVLRIEKGHVAGMELDGRTTPDDLGLGNLVSAKKDSIGKRSLMLAALAAPNRRQLVGLVPLDGTSSIPRGAQIVENPAAPSPNPIIGHATATCYSPTLGKPIALALLENGRALMGQSFYATSPLAGKTTAVTVTSPVFVDSAGVRVRG